MKKFILLISFSFFIYNVNIDSQNKDSLYKVTDGIYTISGFTGNISFLVTKNNVVLVDAGENHDGGRRIKEIIATVTKNPIADIVITHYHYDHTNGLNSLPQNIPIIAQKNTKQNQLNRINDTKKEIITAMHHADSIHAILNKLKPTDKEFAKIDSSSKAIDNNIKELKNRKFVIPSVLVDSLKTLVVDNDTIELIYPGKAHTNGDLVVWFKNRNTMVLGDLLFNRAFPYIDPLGDTENWANQLRKFVKTDVKYFIPGHMGTATVDDVLLFANYQTDLRNAIKKYIDEGKSKKEIKDTLKLPAYDNFGFQFFREQNIEAVYDQLKKD